VPIQFYLRR